MRGQIMWSEFFHKSFKDASFVMKKNVTTVATGALWNYRGETQWQCSMSWYCLWWLCLHKGWSSSRINIDL